MADKGNYYKHRSIEWLRGLGYQVEPVEKLQCIVTKTGRMIFLKKDVFASDGIAIGNNEVIFWNSILTKHNLADHIRGYMAIPFPECKHIKVWIIIWEKGDHFPEIFDLADVKKELEA